VDNLTHILAGLVAAEVVTRVRARKLEPRTEWVRAAYFASALANNVPDLDFAYVGISGQKLGYLLHHRGHTHTLLGGVPLGLVALGLVYAWARRRKHAFDRADWLWLGALSLFGPLLHLFMDSWNSYGVHPFWPFDNRWFYGDRVFIVEPLFWAAALPSLFLAAGSRGGKTALALWLSLTVLLPFVSRMVPLAICVFVLVWVVGALALLARATAARRVAVALGSTLAVLAVFGLAKRQAEAKARARLAAQYPDETLHDLVLSPNPANPACFQFLAVQTGPAGSYALRSGRLSLVPALIAADACQMRAGSPTAPLRAVAATNTRDVVIEREFVASVSELQRLARQSCEVAAFLRFSRAPFWTDQPGTGLIVGDLRYDREPGIGFAELVAERTPRTCPSFVPPWDPPRSDVLALPASGP
jgi:inner membrane protein